MTDQKMKHSALAYARKGFFVFPLHTPTDGGCSCNNPDCGNVGKHPRTRHGFKDASNDPERVAAWWDRWPDANIGVATGAGSGLVVLDIDPRNDGGDSLAELERLNGALRETPMVLTGGGGQHYYFRRPDGDTRKGRSGYRHGVDVKADGGYVVAPPSLHASGGTYEWDAGAHLLDVELAGCPEWLEKSLIQSEARHAASTAPPDRSFLGLAFTFAGWSSGRTTAGGSKLIVQCPWEDEHTGGTRYDSSTVIFPASAGRDVGWFHCSHSHCHHARTLDDVVQALPASALDAAAAELEHPPGWRPGVRRELPQQTTRQVIVDGGNWEQAIICDQRGNPRPIAGNVALLLANDPAWTGSLYYDAFRDRVAWASMGPHLPGLHAPLPGEVLADHHVTYVQQWMASRNIQTSEAVASAGIAAAARMNERHTVREYLAELKWDGVRRIADWLPRYCGAEQSEYVRCVGRWWLISAVARIMDPGCQVDHMLILEGRQAARKSTTARVLGGEWYSGELPTLQDAERAGMAVQGAWIIEAAELDALKGAHSARVKDFLTKTTDRYRAPWTRHHVDRARQCVFIGTTNEGRYVQDPTGARRYWPVHVVNCDVKALAEDRDQLWAEAVAAWGDGEAWWPERDHPVMRELEAAQRERQERDVWEERVLAWASRHTHVTVDQILGEALGIEPGRWTPREQGRISAILTQEGWERKRVMVDGLRRTCWANPVAL